MRGLDQLLISWAQNELKYWEQAALDKILRGGEITDSDLEELVRYFIEDTGLSPVEVNRPRLFVFEKQLAYAQLAPCRLSRIFNLKNVNALPRGQEIRFGPQLTLIYGNNGAGKSGYARTLASAAVARGERKVLPNATGAESTDAIQADIELSYADATHVATWTVGDKRCHLPAFYAFDDSSMTAHLTGSNSMSVQPAGLFLLTELAELTDAVRQELRGLIDENQRHINFEAFFDGQSDIKDWVSRIHAGTDVQDLHGFVQLTPDDLIRQEHFEKEIAELILLDVNKQVAKRQQEIRDLEKLVQSVQVAETELGELSVEGINSLLNTARRCREDATTSSVAQFTFEPFSQVGTKQWREFLIAARALATSEAHFHSTYPQPGDHCLFCRQELSSQAAELIGRLWNFLDSDAQARLVIAESECSRRETQLRNLNLNYFAADSNVRRLLDEELPTDVIGLEVQLASCEDRRSELQNALQTKEVRSLPPLIAFDVGGLKSLISIRQNDVKQLQNSDRAQRLATLQKAVREFRHRQILSEHMNEISAYVTRARWAVKVQESLGSTRSITTKHNELFQELVTDRYVTLFEETLKRFKKDVKVTIETRGFKGETVRQLVLSPKSFRTGFSVDQILSEGEKRAVAMADFLTEAALDPDIRGVILDDPVTSLDDNWKKVLAECLAELAQNRQVVVFTHDLVFLYRIKERADALTVDTATHWIMEKDGHPGFVYLDNSPLCEKDFRSAKVARECYAKAKIADPEEQQMLLQHGFAALRTSYEALIIFDIFNEVIQRFEERLSVGRLNDVYIDPIITREIIKRVESLSRYIGAHLHSDKFAPTKPAPAELLDEINNFESLRQAQKDLKKRSDKSKSSDKPAKVPTENAPKLAEVSQEGDPPHGNR
jgi:energy-coupling factor transporter ATP-binding protein EcfA2